MREGGIRRFLALSVSSRFCAIFRIRRLHSSLFSRLPLVHPPSCGLMAYCLRSPFTLSALGSHCRRTASGTAYVEYRPPHTRRSLVPHWAGWLRVPVGDSFDLVHSGPASSKRSAIA